MLVDQQNNLIISHWHQNCRPLIVFPKDWLQPKSILQHITFPYGNSGANKLLILFPRLSMMYYVLLHFDSFIERGNDIRHKLFASPGLLARKPYFEVYVLAITSINE